MVTKSICIISTLGGTINRFVIPSARELKKRGFEVTLMASMDDAFIEKNKGEFLLINIPMERGVKPLGMLKAIWAFYQIFSTENFSIIQYATPNAAFYASIAGWLAGIKARIYCQWGIRYVGFDGSTRKLFRCIEKITCQFSTAIRPASELNLQFAIEEGLYTRSKAKVLGKGGAVGIDLAVFNTKWKEEFRNEIIAKHQLLDGKFIFGFVGRLEKDKGVNELLGAFRELRKTYSDIALVIVGSFDKMEGLNSKLLEYAKNDTQIIFTGYSNEVQKYTCAFNVLAHPTYREGFGLVILEAMALGTAIITTNIPGASETIENDISGLLCTARNTESLMEAMLKLYKSPLLCSQFSDEGVIRVVNHFTQGQMNQYIVDDREVIYHKTYKNEH